MARLRRLFALPPPRRRVLLEAALLMCCIRAALALVPLGIVRRALAALARARAPNGAASDAAVLWAVDTAARHLRAVGTCLTRALTGQVLLERRGFPAVVRIGVMRTAEGAFRAHAWLERGNGAVRDAGQEGDRSGYALLPALHTAAVRVRPRLAAYEVYGLHLRSELPLPAPCCDCATHDLEVRWGAAGAIPDTAPEGRLLAQLPPGPGGGGYTHTMSPAGYTLRYHGVAEVRLDPARRAARIHLAPGVDPEIAALLLTGNVLALLLALEGRCVLHASAVACEDGDGAVAFAGGVGMGKSTLAALCCAAGARLITDDLLRLDRDGESLRCALGTRELRLRGGATGLLAHFTGRRTRPTGDGRVALELGGDIGGMPPLRAIVLPQPQRTAVQLRLRRLGPLEAMRALLGCARVAGLEARELAVVQFALTGDLARRVPVYEAAIPWGPPFGPELAAALLAVGRRAGAGRAAA